MTNILFIVINISKIYMLSENIISYDFKHYNISEYRYNCGCAK